MHEHPEGQAGEHVLQGQPLDPHPYYSVLRAGLGYLLEDAAVLLQVLGVPGLAVGGVACPARGQHQARVAAATERAVQL